MDQDVRWEQRFQNFTKSISLLNEIKELEIGKLSLLEKEGIIQRFEFTLELAWKKLKDKIEFDGIILDRISPKMVLKEVYQAKYINNIEVWIQMINDRNLVSHTYDFETFEEIIPSIQKQYISVLNELFVSLKNE
jgi:nucleotidyltransferase substrate binding protein (TIGR01987 family)